MKENRRGLPTKDILDIPITALSFEEQIFLMLKWARFRESRVVCLANVHMLMESYWKQEFASVLNTADLVAPDGMPLVWMLRQMGIYSQDRVAGMDVFLRLCQLCPSGNVSIYFVGSQTAVLERMRERLEREFPNLQIAGMEPLPFRPLTPSEDESLIQRINNSGAGLLFVCLGCPKQEYWMIQHLNKIQAVMIGIGAVFSLYAGIHKRAPQYIRESGLEWLYRLIQEPRRLWYRYSKTIPPFTCLALKQLLTQPTFQSSDELAENIHSVSSDRLFSDAQLNFLTVDLEPSKIGEILVRQNLISETSLSVALEEQQINPKKLGSILIEKGYISYPELEFCLKNQRIKLGELLVRNKFISQNKLDKFLDKQKSSKKRLGEIMIQHKILSREQLKQLLLEQYSRRKGWWLVADKVNSSLLLAA